MTSRILALVLPVACLAWALPLRAGEEPRWDRVAAERYLDSRMDAWWTNAKTLRTEGGETRCLSCHTALPYVWARQALRHAQATTQPTPHERRVLEQVSRRIGYRGGDQPYYDHTQSDGYATGLVVYALRRSGRPVSSPAVRKGQQWLVDHQMPERAGDPAWAPWRAHSLNYDREHGGPKGEPWRRMFMFDLATAFGVLALL